MLNLFLYGGNLCHGGGALKGIGVPQAALSQNVSLEISPSPDSMGI